LIREEISLVEASIGLLLAVVAPVIALAAPVDSNNTSCGNVQGTCGNSQPDTDYQKGFDAGTNAAQQDKPNCGTDSSCYGDYSIDDCVASDAYGGNTSNPDAYCHGFVKGYYDTAGFPQFDSAGR
jgi:hypothetical protein